MKRFRLLFAALLLMVPMFCSAEKAKSPSQIKVISYNIRNGEAKDGTNSWPLRYHASVAMIEDQKPDIFGLQEAYDYQVDYLQEYTKGYKHVGIGRENGKVKGTDSGEHMSIFYNTKTISLLKWGTYWLSQTPDVPSLGWDAACKRTATWALLKDKSSGKKFWYVNTHLDHMGWEARRNGLKLIVEKIKAMNPEGYPMILTGDFNVEPDNDCLSDLYKMMKSARETAVKTDKRNTFNGWGDKSAEECIDYVWYSGFSSCPVFQVITKPYDERAFISDHYPVTATLIF